MTSLVKIDPSLIAIIRKSLDRNGLPMPFVEEIYLLKTHIAGTTFLDLDEVEPKLKDQDLLIFKRETKNKVDKLAIIIATENGQKLGYIPRDQNPIMARLMDAGKIIFGKLEKKEWVNSWLKLNIRIYLRDL
ncbi:MAG: HIRAN domain-containing protein [Candidatus Marinimicrobia bacterium]|nr:HIRAN domain-containing protein [Candidatus Neomarinimicrobiota bacterium]